MPPFLGAYRFPATGFWSAPRLNYVGKRSLNGQRTGMAAARGTLFVTAGCPYPPTSGTPLRTWQHISLAAELGPVSLVSVDRHDREREAIPGVARWQHIALPAVPAPANHGVPLLRVETATRVAIERFSAAVAPLVTVFSNVWFDPMPAQPPNGTWVYDAHNVYSALAAELKKDAGEAERIERGIGSAAAEVWVCSTGDAHRFASICPDAKRIRVIPNGIDTVAYSDLRSGRLRRARCTAPTLGFIGSFWYAPNAHAAEVLIDDVLPKVRRDVSPEARLVLVGASPSAPMLAAAAADAGIVVPGRVPDVRPYLAICDLVVVPLAHGSGTRLKILEAFAAGKPVVATAKAVEGLDVCDGEHVLIAEDADALATAVARLVREPQLPRRLTRAAFRLVEEQYSWTALRAVLADALSREPVVRT
jgi:glycosyltransferase involved in cell wall biosynthesis